MKTLYILLAVGLFTQAHALTPNDVKNMGKNLKNLNRGPERPASNVCCDPEEELKQLQRQCATELCGPPSKSNTAFLTNKQFEQKFQDEKIDADFEAFRPTIEKYAKKKVEDAKKTLEKIQKNIEKDPEYFSLEKISPEASEELVSEFLSNNIYANVTINPDGSKKIDFEDSGKKFTGVLKELAEEYKNTKRRNIENDFGSGLNAEYYTKEEATTYLRAMLSDALERLTKLKQTNPDFYRNNGYLFEDIAQNGEKILEKLESTEDVFDLYSPYYSLEYIHSTITSVLQDGYDLYKEKRESPVYPAEKAFEAVKKIVGDFDLKQKVKMISESLDKDVSDQINSCRFTWYEKKLMTPELEKEKEFRENLPGYIEKLKKLYVEKRYSASSAKTLMESIEKLQKHFGVEDYNGEPYQDNLSEFKENLKNELEPETDEGETEGEEAAQEDEEDGKPQITKDMDALEDFLSWDHTEAQVYELIEDHCEQRIFTADDHFVDDERIHISAFSCNHPRTGKQVLSHELGHALSFAFLKSGISEESSESFLKTRACVKGIHISPPESGGGHEGDTQYIEEDMADFVAAMSNPEPDLPLLSCALLQPSDDGDYWESPSIINPISQDPHSSGLFRSITEATYKNRVLPVSCVEAMEAFKDKVKYVECE